MRRFRIRASVCAALSFLSLSSSRCSFLELPSSSVTILSYNLQTLFDDRDDGPEFPGWSVQLGQWDTEGYRLRLRNLADAVEAAAPGGPDVAVLLEAENRRTVDDLANLLPGNYPTRIVAGGEGQALHTVVLSRFPLISARAHAVCPDPEYPNEELRPLLEAVLDADGVQLTVLAAHWKSKLGGAAETEPLRRAQAVLAARRIREILEADPAAEVVLAGDFNENPDEWERVSGAYPTAFLPAGALSEAPVYGDRILVAADPGLCGAAQDGLALWCPWEESGGFSYVYEGAEERIDSFFVAPGLLDDRGLSFRAFSAQAPGILLTEDGLPWEWDAANREGYSDHLPIRMELKQIDG